MNARFWWAFGLLGCPVNEDSGEGRSAYEGPELIHVPAAAATSGEAMSLVVSASDPDGVAGVKLYYRVEGGPIWTPASTTLEGEAYTAIIPAESVTAPGVEYYFEADDLGDPIASSMLPQNGNREPFVVPVPVLGTAFPFFEDFEPSADESSALSSLGWANASQGFTGYSWALSTRYIYGGAYSVTHARGADGIPTIVDWLISPAIDLSSAPSAQVTWYELGSTPEGSNHGLYLSAGSRDPKDGDYVAIKAALPAPPSLQWARSAGYDLSAHVGSVVYLAWRFEGSDSDDWYMDDVAVSELTSDLSAAWTTSPSEIYPGEFGTLAVALTNDSTVPATNVRIEAEFSEGGAVFSASSTTLGRVEGSSTAELDLGFTIDSSTINNRYLPVQLSVSSDDGSFIAEGEVLVGQMSTASLSWEGLSAGSLLVEVGVGDPDAPDWSTTVFSGSASAGFSTFTADITDAYPYLPPAAGEQRWWARVDTAVSGEITDFNVRYDGMDYASIALPLAVTSEDTSLVYVPTPPLPLLAAYSSTPSEIDPGSSGITLDFSVVNVGEVSMGPLYATLRSTDPDLAVVDAGPFVVDPDLFQAGEVVGLSGAFSFDVSAAHVNSQAVQAELLLDDGVDTWVLPLSFEVPFPVFVINRVELDDDSRDGDLDADEEADLGFRITNQGDEAASGLVYATLAATTTGSAVVSTDDNVESLGTMGSGATEVINGFEVVVEGGAAGDDVDLILTFVDSVRSYEATFPLVLGDLPWQGIADIDDPIGDPVVDGQVDIVKGSYRATGDLLQIRITFAGTPDLSTLFLTAWASATSADYDLYELGAQSGVGSLRGYSFTTSSFYDLDDPAVSYPDANTVQIDLSITALGLTFDEFTLGFGGGFCGEPDYYCDHFPDGWGYPYVSYNPSDWYTLSW